MQTNLVSAKRAMPSLLELCISFYQAYLKPGEVALDMTVGNGHDTAFLAKLVGGSGHVYGFDVQEEALKNAQIKLAGHSNIQLYLKGHEHFAEVLPIELKGNISAAMFNLGYLPGSSKEIVTKASTTLVALNHLQEWLRAGAGMSIHIYMGHSGGNGEGEAVIIWAKKLLWQDWKVASYEIINKNQNREILLIIVKR